MRLSWPQIHELKEKSGGVLTLNQSSLPSTRIRSCSSSPPGYCSLASESGTRVRSASQPSCCVWSAMSQQRYPFPRCCWIIGMSLTWRHRLSVFSTSSSQASLRLTLRQLIYLFLVEKAVSTQHRLEGGVSTDTRSSSSYDRATRNRVSSRSCLFSTRLA